MIPAGKLGDIVCSTPLLYAMRRVYPHAKIYVLGNTITRGVLENSGLYDEYIVDTMRHAQLVLKLREIQFDVACLNGSSFLLLSALYMARIPFITVPYVQGLSIQQTLPYRILSRLVVRTDFFQGMYIPMQYLKLLEPLGIQTQDTTKRLAYTASAREKVDAVLRQAGIDTNRHLIVGLTPFAGNKIKEWGLDNFASLVKLLLTNSLVRIVVIGGPGDVVAGKEFLSLVPPSTSTVNTIGAFSIDELKACISQCSLFVSVDTGPIYIAEAFNVPTVNIVGPIDEREQPPRGPLHRNVIHREGAQPAVSILNVRNAVYVEARKQVESITPEMVYKECEALLRQKI